MTLNLICQDHWWFNLIVLMDTMTPCYSSVVAYVLTLLRDRCVKYSDLVLDL